MAQRKDPVGEGSSGGGREAPDPDGVRQALDQLNGALASSGVTKYKIGLFDPQELTLLKKNARYMAAPTFRQLAENIAKDGQLESLPLVYLEETGEKIVLSGNHRVQAARKSKVPWILCIVIDWKLSKDERVAKQLAHNALAGQDDVAILKELWGAIGSINDKVYSGIDERTAKTLDSIKFPELKEEPLKYKTVNLVFLPEEIEDVRAFFAHVETLPGDEVWLASLKHYKDFFATVIAAKGAYDVLNAAAVFLKLVEICKHALGVTETSPMHDVKKTEVRVGELAGRIPVATYNRWKIVYERHVPKELHPSKHFAAAFESMLRALEGADAPAQEEARDVAQA